MLLVLEVGAERLQKESTCKCYFYLSKRVGLCCLECQERRIEDDSYQSVSGHSMWVIKFKVEFWSLDLQRYNNSRNLG
eukprot:2079230-Amphidinium_carterae.1